MRRRVRSEIYEVMSAMFGLSGPRLGHNKLTTIIHRKHTPRQLSGFERRDRIAHRKQVRHNRQRLINKRGYA